MTGLRVLMMRPPTWASRCRYARRLGLAGFALAAAAALTGCGESKMVLDGQMKGDMTAALKLEGPMQIQMQMQGPTIKYDGVYISDKLLDRVKIRETRGDWLLAVFGEPTGRAKLDNGSEIWKWSYRPMEQVGSLVSVFGGATKDEPKLQPSTAFVQLTDNIVVEKWRD
jgi:hypothetical protein